MPFYVIQDSDWYWTDNEAGTAHPPIIEADDPEAAIKLAVEQMQAEDDPFDGATLMVGAIKALGLQMMGKDDDGVMIFEDYTPFSASGQKSGGGDGCPKASR